jgi:DNA-binding PadR family transcriptional regulator
MLEYIILGFLLHGEMSGYDIKRFMGISTANFYDASFGSIYPMLKKMEENSLISSTEAVEGGKYKKLYALTDSGRERFFRWLEQPIEFKRASLDHLVNIFFYGFLPREKARELLAGYIARVEAELAGLEKLECAVEHEAGFYEASTLDYGKGIYRFTADWCKRLLEKLPDEDKTKICEER